jgi:hypothetical protein
VFIMPTRFPPMASERTFVMFRFCLCSHESSLRRKEKIISRALADPGGLLRKLLRQRFDLARLSQVAASDFAVCLSVVEAIRQFRRTSRLVSALRNPSAIFQSPAWRRFKAKSAADIRSEKYRPLGGRFERNGLGYCNRHRALSRLRSC